MVYLDNAATTSPCYFGKDYVDNLNWRNSNTNYAFKEKIILNNCRNRIKQFLGVNSGYVLFTRCATESIEWLSNKLSISCSNYEHDSVYNCQNYNHQYKLFCHQLVNQLTGDIYDIESIAKQSNNAEFFGSDLTAAIGHIQLPKNTDNYCDALWWSGHKFGCEKGIGGLWVSNKLFDFLGGDEDANNQYNLIHGTLNLSAVMAMTDAMGNIEQYNNTWFSYVDHIITHTQCRLISINNHKSYAINLLYFDDILAEPLQTFLATKNIYVGIGGSACSKNKDYRVLNTFGLSDIEAEHCIRISFNKNTTQQDINKLVFAIKEYKAVINVKKMCRG